MSHTLQVCLLTPGQPSNNPRLVKEADALAEAGHRVHVICADSGLWPTEKDRELLAKKPWTCEYAGGRPGGQAGLYRWTRIRYGVNRRLFRAAPFVEPWLSSALLSRAAPEIEAAALANSADLYIAHHAALLPIAGKAARAWGAKLGYDAEDFYSGMSDLRNPQPPEERLIEKIERRWLAACDYMTAAAPAIADEYVNRFGIARPVPVLNTFPLSDRPKSFRPTRPADSLRLYWFSQCVGADRGLEDAVRAMGLLKGHGIELHLRGNWQAGYRERLFRLAAEVGVSPQIHAYEPAAPDEMVRLASEYDVGLAIEQFISRNDDLRLTNKIFTYLLAGNAVIGTRTPAQQEFLASVGPAASTYEAGNALALASQLRVFHSNRQGLDNARRCAWEWGERRYNWDFEKRYFHGAVEAACGVQPAVESASH